MRFGVVVCVLILGIGTVQGQEKPDEVRYGIFANLETYPQATPKDTLASVVTALENKRIDYLLAQLADPEFVDQRVKDVFSGNFDELVRETTTKLSDNPGMLKDLRHFLKEGEWESGDGTARARVKDIKDRQIFMKRIGKRWYLENRQKPEAEK
jgi:hypothetical protein